MQQNYWCNPHSWGQTARIFQIGFGFRADRKSRGRHWKGIALQSSDNGVASWDDINRIERHSHFQQKTILTIFFNGTSESKAATLVVGQKVNSLPARRMADFSIEWIFQSNMISGHSKSHLEETGKNSFRFMGPSRKLRLFNWIVTNCVWKNINEALEP
jgi:hypothetical protein